MQVLTFLFSTRGACNQLLQILKDLGHLEDFGELSDPIFYPLNIDIPVNSQNPANILIVNFTGRNGLHNHDIFRCRKVDAELSKRRFARPFNQLPLERGGCQGNIDVEPARLMSEQ